MDNHVKCKQCMVWSNQNHNLEWQFQSRGVYFTLNFVHSSYTKKEDPNHFID